MAEVTNIEEHDDGTATLHLDLTDEEVKMLIRVFELVNGIGS